MGTRIAILILLAGCASSPSAVKPPVAAPPPREKPKFKPLVENGMIFVPMKGGDWTHDESFEDVSIDVGEGVKTFSWYKPAPPGGFTILFLHGNAGNIANRKNLFTYFGAVGAGAFLLDYRGYGKSTGLPFEAGVYEDAHCAFEWLVAHGVDPKKIVLYGESLGTAIATEIARRVECAGVVLQSPFTNLEDVAAKMDPRLAGRGLPVQKFDSLSRIAAMGEPLLVIHSRADEMIPFEQGRRLFDAAREPKFFCELQRAGHNKTWSERDAVEKALREFLTGLSSTP